LGPYLKKSFTKIGLVEWLKVKALSSSLSITKAKQNCKEVLKVREKSNHSQIDKPEGAQL
jgi:hypothetical protein